MKYIPDFKLDRQQQNSENRIQFGALVFTLGATHKHWNFTILLYVFISIDIG